MYHITKKQGQKIKDLQSRGWTTTGKFRDGMTGRTSMLMTRGENGRIKVTSAGIVVIVRN